MALVSLKQQEKKLPKYPQLGLWDNPYSINEELAREDEPERQLLDFIYNREIGRVSKAIVQGIESGQSSLWVLKDQYVERYHSDTVTAGVFRTLLALEQPRVFASLSLLTLVYEDFLPRTLRMLLDRIQPESFRLCLYSYVYRELKKAVEQGEAAAAFPETDVEEWTERINETDGQALDDILFPKVEEEEVEDELEDQEVSQPEGQAGDDEASGSTRAAEENLEQESQAGDLATEEPEKERETGCEAGAEEESEEELEEETEETPEEKLRGQLVAFMELRLKEAPFGRLVSEAFRRGLESLEAGLVFLQTDGEAREALIDVLKMLGQYYGTTVTLIDQIDGWYMLEEDEQRRVISAIAEFRWLTQGYGYTVLLSKPDTFEQMPEDFVRGMSTVSTMLRLPPTKDGSLSIEEATETTAAFVGTQRAREDGQLAPFTKEAVEQLLNSVDGNAVAFLKRSGQLIDEAAKKGLDKVDQALV